MKKTSFLSHNMTSKIYTVCVIELKYNIANIIRKSIHWSINIAQIKTNIHINSLNTEGNTQCFAYNLFYLEPIEISFIIYDLLKNIKLLIFSSPEHKVLRVSYCDRSLSVVRRRASCVVRKLFYLNSFSSETAHWILTKLHRNDPWVVPYQSCSNGSDWLHK